MRLLKNMNHVLTAIAISGLFLNVSCNEEETEGSDPVNLTENEQQLVGTWRHVYTEGGISPGPVDFGTFEWTFDDDRSGTYYQNPDGASEQTNSFFWKVESDDDIVFMDEEGNGDPVYRIEEYGQDTMRWFNYTLGDTYMVEKQ